MEFPKGPTEGSGYVTVWGRGVFIARYEPVSLPETLRALIQFVLPKIE